MITKLITYLLDKLIGKYVENFTSNNVKTGLFQGDIRLENLPLKKGVLEDLTDCPIIVKSGLIGRVTLRIPYTKLRTQAWAIMLEDIYIVASPNFKTGFSREKEMDNEINAKKIILDTLETKWKKNINNYIESTKAQQNSWLSSVASFGYRVLRNIQVEVRNVHIRYEDSDTIPSQTFALGLVVDGFSTKSSDFEWDSKNDLKVDSNMVQKILDLNDIRIYLDPIVQESCEDFCVENLKSILLQKLQQIPISSYIMQPISIHGTMKRHLTIMPIYDQPRISLNLQMEQLEVSLTQSQYQTSVVLINEFDRFDRQKQHIKTRPFQSVTESPRLWWKFAIKEHIPNVCKGELLSKRARDIVSYVQLYEEHLLETDINISSFNDELETELEFDIIVELREIAMERANRKSIEILKQMPTKSPNSQVGWWSYLWGRKSQEIPLPISSTTISSETTQILERILPDDNSNIHRELEQDITDILDEIDHEATNFFTKDKIFLKGNFSLTGIRIHLLQDISHPILDIHANNLTVSFESRPSYGSWSMKVALRSLLMQDLGGDDIDSPFINVISCINDKNEDREIFMLAFEKNPLPLTSIPGIKKRLAITSEPLTIVHCPRLINNVQQYFESIRSNKNIRAVAQRHIRNAKIRTKASIKEMIEKETAIDKWQIFLKISAPKLVLPNYVNRNHSTTNCILLDLGRLQVSNCDEKDLYSLMYDVERIINGDDSDFDDDEDFVTPTTSPLGSLEDISKDSTVNEIISKDNSCNIYEEYSIVLDNIMVLVGTWTELKSMLNTRLIMKRTDIMLMQPFKLQLNLKRKYFQDFNFNHPNIIVKSTITRLLINISDTKLNMAKGCLNSLTNYFNEGKPNLMDKGRRYQKDQLNIFDSFNLNIDNQKQLLSASFVLHALIIQLESDNRPLAELTFREAQFNMVQYRSKTCIDLLLLSMIMADARANLGSNLDFILASHKGAYIDSSVVSRDIDDPLIKLFYEIKRGCGAEADHHNVNVIFSGLDMIANQETITEIVSFVKEIINDESQNYSSENKNSSESQVEYLDFSVTCRCVSVLFINILIDEATDTRSALSIGTMSLTDMDVHLVIKASSVYSTATIRKISIHDLSTPNSLHKQILSLSSGSSDNHLSCDEKNGLIKIVFNKESSTSPYNITGTMPHFIYVHSPPFINSVEQCVTNFQVYLTRFKNNITAAARTAILSSPIHENDFGLFKMCRFHIQILSPILVLPRNKASNEVIIVHLGDIDIFNKDTSLTLIFSDATVISRKLLLKDGKYDIKICTDTKNGFFLLKKTNLTLTISKLTHSSFTGIDINAEFSSLLSISLSKDVYEQVLNSLDNIVYDDDDVDFSSMEDTPTPSDIDSQELPIRVHSNMAELKVELYPDTFVVCMEPMLRLTLRGIYMEFIRQNKFIKDILFEINNLSLYQLMDATHNQLYHPLLYCTYSQYSTRDIHRNTSVSCPDLSDFNELYSNLDFVSDLPQKATMDCQLILKRRKSHSNTEEIVNNFSFTDKSMKCHNGKEKGKLVKIKVQLIDKKIPDFQSTYDGINRFIEASFADLTCHITTHIWVILLDFFGLGSKFFDPNDIKQLSDVTKVLPSFNRRYDGEIEEIINKKLSVEIKQLDILIENEIKYINHDNLAGLTIKNLLLNIDSKDGNLKATGSVENFQLDDLSPTGAIYKNRLFPATEQKRLFEFDIFKYGLPDPGLLREEDMRISVRINSPIVYVHTQRFLQELNQYVQNFFQYQDRLSHMRVTSAGRIVDKSASRSARIRMKVSCQAPLLLIPVSVFSDHLLVVDLGRFVLHNEFKFAQNDSTKCLLDEMCIDLQYMDLYSAIRIAKNATHTDIVLRNIIIRPITPKPLSQKCNLHLTVSRNLDSNVSHSSPDWLLNGTLSSVICSLNHDQYRTIRGVLCHNLGENVDHLQIHRFQAFQVDPHLHTNLTGVVWLGMKLVLYLNDVQVNLMSPVISDTESECMTLCKMNYLQSTLSYESYSDYSKTIQLECQDITVEDLRYQSYPVNKRPSVFPIILTRDNNLNEKDSSPCQLKVRYTSSNERNEFHVFLNTMKVITIFDWLKMSQAWIFTPPYEIISLSEVNENQFDEFASLYVQSRPGSKIVSLPAIAIRERYKEIVKEEFKSTKITFEVEESRFFILEQLSQSYSNALILTVAGSFTYYTREFRLGPFNFNIPRLHLASCSMSSNSSNLLSIVNPVKIQVKTEEKYNGTKSQPSLENVLQDDSGPKILVHVSMSNFKVRLSFCDLQLLATILKSLPSQTSPPANVAHQTGSIRHKWSSISSSESMENSSTNQPLKRLSKYIETVSFTHLDTLDFISICLIDDCIDADVPLFDIKFSNLLINWHLGLIHEASMSTLLSMDYYNINSFGWTPIIEPWALKFSWKFTNIIELQLKSEEILNIDVSSHLLQMCRNTHKKWSTELAEKNCHLDLVRRERAPFVPFIIVNELGSLIKYAKLSIDKPPSYDAALNYEEVVDYESWFDIPDYNPQTLCFDKETTARDKIRYDGHGMHYNSSHRIELVIDGYQKCQPITVDKLGIFYRDMISNDINNSINDRIRIVIEIIRQGSVQNKIIIRSSLQCQNSLNIPIQIRLYKDSSEFGHFINIDSNSNLAIPLFYVHHQIQVKPISPQNDASSPVITNCLFNTPIDFSEDLIGWQTVSNAQKIDKEIICPTPKTFHTDKVTTAVYLICTVERLDFPTNLSGLPGHIITISAPLCIENLLPYDLKFDTSLESKEDSRLKVTNCGVVNASKNCTILTSSMSLTTLLSIELENFQKCKKLIIPGNVKLSHIVLMCLYDNDNRTLELQVKVESRPNGPVYVTIFASYWIVNRTSLPLVYAQAGNQNHLAAGQSDENENASSSMPFPFSFSNNDTYQLVIRLGNKTKATNGDQLRPAWSPKLSLDKLGTATIQLKAALPDINRPYLQYNIGLEIRAGKGKHRCTTMVILTSRYLLDNMSNFTLKISQYKCVKKENQDISITALPKSMLSFHWPRDDLDPLLSIQLLNSKKEDISHWSGGFRIDQTNSFHVYLRGVHNNITTQIRVTVTLQGAHFRVVFSDTDGLPPPYLLRNHTRLQLFFSQIVPEDKNTKYSLMAPNSNTPYALDEPTLPANVTLSVEGGSHSTYNLNTIGPATSLHYENFLYIVVQSSENVDNSELVFDVQSQNRRVFLNYKKPGSRSQLWYYSSNNELFHEGSIAPHDPKEKIDRSKENHYLLDVDLIAPTQSAYNQQKYHMKLAKADHRRDKFQRWHFTDDGCLTNTLGMKCRVVANCQNAPVFSTFMPVVKTRPLIISQDWLRPGSGTVLVSILTNGPTRVLRIYDAQDSHLYSSTNMQITSNDTSSKVEIAVQLKEVGIFLINHIPEELLYFVCSEIEVEWSRQRNMDHFEINVRTIQCDNQLMDTGFPCLIYQDTSRITKSSSTITAFSLNYERELGHPFDIHVFNNIKVHLVPLNIILEEKLLLRVIQMLSPPSAVTKKEEENFIHLLHNTDFHEGKKIYIGTLRVLTGTMCLSVITADSLPADLKPIKKLIPYLMSFANAQIPIEPYNREHVFETDSLIFQSLANHYQNQLHNQAIKIFGSVDFLGNPIGFISDITYGMKRLCADQNVSDMFKHFAHGIGDSTAKICNSASRVVYGMTLDPDYQEKRQILLDEARISNSNTAHVKAGFKSLINGFVGGALSVPVQSWKGYKDDGSSGLFAGALKGIVGVVTKPVGGILDFATGSAASFREMARSSREGQPDRKYEPRCLSSSWKLLPFYSSYSNNLRHAIVISDLAQAQILLAKFSKLSSPLENVVGLLVIQRSVDSQMKILVSDSSIHVINTTQDECHRMKYYSLSQLSSPPVSITKSSSGNTPYHLDKVVYIKFNCFHSTDHQVTPSKASGPLFKCDSESVAKQVVKLVCEAQCDYLERQMTLVCGTL